MRRYGKRRRTKNMRDLRVHILQSTNSYPVIDAARVKTLQGVTDILINNIT